MVEFCPRCDNILTPVKKKDGVFLVCRICGFEKKAKANTSGYRVALKVSEDKHTKTAVLKDVREISPEDREKQKELLQEYYEIFLETMAGETEEFEED